MSHIPQRKEKDCLNCGTIVQGKYCHNCGQENVVPKETFWHMVTHFFYDITHFDSNFFHTIHHLILKPGFLSKEYMIGKRARYLHPIKMYVFTSAIFFLLFFSFFSPTPKKANSNPTISITGELENKDSTVGITFTKTTYHSVEEYDSLQSILPSSKRDGWIEKTFKRKIILAYLKYKKDPVAGEKRMLSLILHNLPYMLFVSLPLFALILRLVYIRQRKKFFFADHGVFTIHLYVFSFIVLLAIFCISALQTATHWDWLTFLVIALFLVMFFYLFIAMRNFYGQRKGKTFVKFMLVAILSLIMMLVLFLLFILFSAFTF